MTKKAFSYGFAILVILMLSANNGFSWISYGNDINSLCAPATPYTGNCVICHTVDKDDSLEAQEAFSKGGEALTDFFCPEEPRVH